MIFRARCTAHPSQCKHVVNVFKRTLAVGAMGNLVVPPCWESCQCFHQFWCHFRSLPVTPEHQLGNDLGTAAKNGAKLLLVLAGCADTQLLPKAGKRSQPGLELSPICLGMALNSGKTQGYGVGRAVWSRGGGEDLAPGRALHANFPRPFSCPGEEADGRSWGAARSPWSRSTGSLELCGVSVSLFITQFLHLLLFVVLVPRRQSGHDSSMLSAKQIYSIVFNSCFSKDLKVRIISWKKCRRLQRAGTGQTGDGASL